MRPSIVLPSLVLLAACQSTSPTASTEAQEPPRSTKPVLSAVRPVRPPPSTLLPVGAPAPDLTATTHEGQPFKLADHRGRPVIVYFYPKDDTPGCTAEAEGLREEWPALQRSNAIVVGVSTDDVGSHQAFAKKYRLPFALLPDVDHEIAAAFGVPINLGVAKRVTFLIDKHGRIRKVFPAVSPEGHAKELVSALAEL